MGKVLMKVSSLKSCYNIIFLKNLQKLFLSIYLYECDLHSTQTNNILFVSEKKNH